jgi:hypothetical protein
MSSIITGMSGYVNSPDNQVVTKISEEEMQEVYNWVDEIPLSRPKKNIARDFSDCGKYFLLVFNDLTFSFEISTYRRNRQELLTVAR